MSSSALDDAPLTFFPPGGPTPVVFNIMEHLARLYDRRNPNSPTFDRVELHKNIRALIELCEKGQRKDDSIDIFIIDDKAVCMFQEAIRSSHWAIPKVRRFFLSCFR